MPQTQQGTQTVPSPPTDTLGVSEPEAPTMQDKLRPIISRLSGGGTPAIDAAMQQHYARQKAQADLAGQQIQQLARAYAHEQDPEKKAQLAQQWEASKENYLKIVGKDKNAKSIAQKTLGFIEHLAGHQPPGQQGQQTVPPPPQGSKAPEGNVPPPPGASKSVPWQLEAMGAPERDEMMKQQYAIHTKSEEKRGEVSADVEGLSDGLKKAGFTTEQVHEVVRGKFGGAGLRAAQKMHPIMVMDPSDPTKKIPALQATAPDENGAFPVYDSQGRIIANPQQLVPQFLPTEHVGEMPVFNPVTGQVEQQPTYSTTRKLPPSGDGKPASGGKSASSGKSSTVPPPPGSGGRHGIPMRQFTPLQKQATAIDEARNALIGDDPTKVGGLAADLDVFKNPESVRKIGEYLELVNSQVANEAKSVIGQGPMAAVEWYAQLPQTVIGLQQEALRDASKGLSPQEQRFVADYYRVMGTVGGLRAATGASSAQWSFNTLKSELPTPGPVTSYDEAKRRIRNYVQETNVVAKRNPLSAKTNPSKVDEGDYIYAKDPQGQLHRAKKGTALPKGWTTANAPTN